MIVGYLTNRIKRYYLTGSYETRVIFVICVILIPPLVLFPLMNVVNDEIRTPTISNGDISKVKIRISEITYVSDLDVGGSKSGYIWLVENIKGGPDDKYLIFGETSILQYHSIGRILWVRVEKYSVDIPLIESSLWRHSPADYNPDELPILKGLEIKGLIFWDYQIAILIVFYGIAIVMRRRIRSAFDKIMGVNRSLIKQSKVTDQLPAIACNRCGEPVWQGQMNCEICFEPIPSCVICLQKPTQIDRMSLLTCCRNYVHKEHITRWLKYYPHCPACRCNFPVVRKISIYNS